MLIAGENRKKPSEKWEYLLCNQLFPLTTIVLC